MEKLFNTDRQYKSLSVFFSSLSTALLCPHLFTEISRYSIEEGAFVGSRFSAFLPAINTIGCLHRRRAFSRSSSCKHFPRRSHTCTSPGSTSTSVGDCLDLEAAFEYFSIPRLGVPRKRNWLLQRLSLNFLDW